MDAIPVASSLKLNRDLMKSRRSVSGCCLPTVNCSIGNIGELKRDGNILVLSFHTKNLTETASVKSSVRDLTDVTDASYVSLMEKINKRAMLELKPNSVNLSPLTPLGFLERAAAVYGGCISVVYNQTEYTWSDTYDRCLRVASVISSMGIGKHDVVSVLAPNVPAMYELHFAVPMAGAVLNNINTRLDAKTMSVLLQHSGSKLVFVDCLLKAVALEAIDLFPAKEPKPLLILMTDEFESEEANSMLGGHFCMSYDHMVERGDADFEMILPDSEWDPIALNYTSGTTSAPKGVVLSHRGLCTLTLDLLIEWAVPKRPIYLWTLPMFHANGWCFTWGVAAVGGTNICVRKFNPALIYCLIEKHRVTHLCGAPVVLNMLSNCQETLKPLTTPVQVMTAGAPPPAAVLYNIESLGFVVTHGYGLTETGGPTVTCAWKPEWSKLPLQIKAKMKARQGVRTLLLTGVDVIDPATGAAVPCDGSTVGEVVMKGNSVMLGYYKNMESTAQAMVNGWLLSGDVGVKHEDGYLEIKDRSKDVIISGGENISSVEVESVLFMHPSINEAAVVARPDEFWGETPCAFVSLKRGLSISEQPSEKELIEFCRERMPRYMVPKTVVFKADLPKTSTGKVQKYLLRELAIALNRG